MGDGGVIKHTTKSSESKLHSKTSAADSLMPLAIGRKTLTFDFSNLKNTQRQKQGVMYTDCRWL
jgi:hypothetical protein